MCLSVFSYFPIHVSYVFSVFFFNVMSLCLSAFHSFDKIPETNYLKGERLILAHSFSPWSVGCFVLGPVVRQHMRLAKSVW
jgi:hypothetical protein